MTQTAGLIDLLDKLAGDSSDHKQMVRRLRMANLIGNIRQMKSNDEIKEVDGRGLSQTVMALAGYISEEILDAVGIFRKAPLKVCLIALKLAMDEENAKPEPNRDIQLSAYAVHELLTAMHNMNTRLNELEKLETDLEAKPWLNDGKRWFDREGGEDGTSTA